MYKPKLSFLGSLRTVAFSTFSVLALLQMQAGMAKAHETQGNLPLEGKKILFILSSQAKLGGESPRAAGLWADSLAMPYEILTKEGATIAMASVKGGKPPLDPRSVNSDFANAYTKAFKKDSAAQALFAHTKTLSEVKAEDYDALCFTSSYGMFYDLADNQESIRLITDFERSRKPIALISQGPVVLKHVTDLHGEPLVKGKTVTSFRNSEEAGSKLAIDYSIFPASVLKTMDNGRTYKTAKLPEDKFLQKLKLVGTVPFLTETFLKSQGAEYKSRKNWEPYVVEALTNEGGILLTAQNPDSTELWVNSLSDILMHQEKVQSNIAAKGAIELPEAGVADGEASE